MSGKLGEQGISSFRNNMIISRALHILISYDNDNKKKQFYCLPNRPSVLAFLQKCGFKPPNTLYVPEAVPLTTQVFVIIQEQNMAPTCKGSTKTIK